MISHLREESQPVRIGSSLPMKFKPKGFCLVHFEIMRDFPAEKFQTYGFWTSRRTPLRETGRFLYRIQDTLTIENGWVPSRSGLLHMGYPAWGWNGVEMPPTQVSLKHLHLSIPTWDDVLATPLQWSFLNSYSFAEQTPEYPSPSQEPFWSALHKAQMEVLLKSDGLVKKTWRDELDVPNPTIIGRSLEPVPAPKPPTVHPLSTFTVHL